MNWQEIRAQYPLQSLLIEAVKAHSEGENRILEKLSVINTYADSTAAMQANTQQHRESPGRELYVFHTSRETLDVLERQWLGIRVAQ